MAKRQNDKNKAFKMNIPIFIISIILIIGALFLQNTIALRPILWFIAIILIALNIGLSNKLKKSFVVIIILILLTISLILDGILVITLKIIPVFSYNIISTEKSIVYNGIGVRVWQCDKENYKDLIVDPFYKKGYMCGADDMSAIDSNSFLNSVVINYDDYKNNYVKIKGKISKKTGQNYIEMQPYKTSDITVNGYVEFADNITLRIIFNENEKLLDDYDVYDEITIIGIVKNLEQDSSKYVIYMYDGKVVSNINLNEYSITVTSEKKCSSEKILLHQSDTNNIYTNCIEEIIVSYPDNNYELATALSSNKITINEIYETADEVKTYDSDNRKLYKFDNYSVLVCDQTLSKDIIIGAKNMSFKDVECQPKVEQ